MAPATNGEQQRGQPTKKSLRIWVRNGGHVMRKKNRETFIYPRTVEAAQDPFQCPSGKNKMFYLIAINLFPDSKIIRPDDSDSEPELVEAPFKSNRCTREETSFPNCKVTKSDANIDRDPVSSSDSSLQASPTTSLCNTKRRRRRPLASARSRPKRDCSTSSCENPHSSSSSSPSSPPKSTLLHHPQKSGGICTPRKLPPVPTIMSSLQTIIRNCSASGLISFSLPKETRRQSRS